MSQEVAAPQIVIVRRKKGGGEGHHSSAWKIAFADFMTAMMALFLVLWLTNATDEATKKQIATYFNPIELTDTTAVPKGIKTKDEKVAEDTKELPDPVVNKNEAMTRGRDEPVDKGSEQFDPKLFNDPYDVIRKLSADSGKLGSGTESSQASQGRGGPAIREGDAFRDPFDPVFRSETLSLAEKSETEDAAEMEEAANTEDAIRAERETEIAAQAQQVETAIRKMVETLGAEQVPDISVTVDKEGVLISLTDNAEFGMFASASALPKAELTELLLGVGKILRETPGSIVVRGHTDGVPFRTAENDNWRLSMARAHASFTALVGAGIDEGRFEKIEGYADRKLKKPDDPLAAGNRRIEILVRSATL